MDPVAVPAFIAIAKIARTRGNRGEILADFYTDFPARFKNLSEVWIEFADGAREQLAIEEAWIHKGRQVLKFKGIDSISSAERLVGAWVEVESNQVVPLPEGSYFDFDLMGCSIRDLSGEELGTVKEILHFEGNPQLVVDGKFGEFLIPATGRLCREVSITKKCIVVDVPEGLIDLNK